MQLPVGASSLDQGNRRRGSVGRLRVGALAALVIACVMTAIGASSAFAVSEPGRDASRQGAASDSAERAGTKAPPAFAGLQHGPLFGHLPPVQENLELVGKLNLISPTTGDPVLEGQIADVAVHKGYAYLNSWDSPTCERRRHVRRRHPQPRDPTAGRVHPGPGALLPRRGRARDLHRHAAVQGRPARGERRDVRLERRAARAPTAPDQTGGGFDLYNVTNPANPVPLVQDAGDRSPEGSEVQNPADRRRTPTTASSSGRTGPRAFLVASDNTELADVDIFDITDPTDPEFINDLDLFELPEVDQIVGDSAQRQRDLPPRRRRQAGRRPDADARVLLGRRLRAARRRRPGQPDVHHRHGLRRPRPADRASTRPRATPTRRSTRTTTSSSWPATRTSTPFRLVSRITEAPFADVAFASALSAAEPIAAGSSWSTGDTVFVGISVHRHGAARRRPA